MDDRTMQMAYKNFWRVQAKDTKLHFSGYITTCFRTRYHPVKGDTSPQSWRCVVESDQGRFMIFRSIELVFTADQLKKLEKMEEIRKRPFEHPELYQEGALCKTIRKVRKEVTSDGKIIRRGEKHA